MLIVKIKKFGPFGDDSQINQGGIVRTPYPLLCINRVKGENVKIVSIYVIIEIFLQEHALKYFQQKVDLEN